MPGDGLKEAARLFYGKRFKEVVRFLEPKIFQFRSSSRFYYYLGISCLYSEDLEGASTYLTRSIQLKNNNVGCLLGLAVIHLMTNEAEESLNTWLKVLELDRRNSTARNGLNMLRRGLKPGDIVEFPSRLRKIYPPVTKKKSLLPVFAVSSAAGITVILAITLLAGRLRSSRPELEEMSFPERGTALVVPDEGARFVFDDREVQSTLSKLKKLFSQYSDNSALVEINRLLLSNASPEVKDLASLMKRYVREPNFSTLKVSFPYSEVMELPILYEDCYVIWRGKIANLTIGEDRLVFEFLVGYHDEKQLEGVLPVIFDFGLNVSNGDNIELLAQIVIEEGMIGLKGVSIHIIQ